MAVRLNTAKSTGAKAPPQFLGGLLSVHGLLVRDKDLSVWFPDCNLVRTMKTQRILRPVLRGNRLTLYRSADLFAVLYTAGRTDDGLPDPATDEIRAWAEWVEQAALALWPGTIHQGKAAALVGSLKLFRQMRASGWLVAIRPESRRALFRTADLLQAVDRIVNGQRPGPGSQPL